MLQSTACVQQTINIITAGSYFLSFYYTYNSFDNNAIQVILDSSLCDQLPVFNYLTLWTSYGFAFDNITAGSHVLTLQGCDPSFNNTSIGICNMRLIPIIQGAGSLGTLTTLISNGTFSSPSISANTFINTSALSSGQLVGWTYSINLFTKICNGECGCTFP